MATMTARMRRIASDWEQTRKDFAGHKNIIVTPVGDLPPEKYHVTYFVNGIYLLPDGRIETLGRHEVDITLHAEYPRYKPICKITTPIWHPNFRDGQICIGDIWGAGESLSDIIINIGDMIQYKSWNSYSPLSAEAAQWAMENKHLFPVGNISLFVADYASAKDTVDIDLFDADGAEATGDAPEATGDAPEATGDVPVGAAENQESSFAAGVATNDAAATEAESTAPLPEASTVSEQTDSNDFNITAEELAGIEYIPTAQRMQSVSHGGMVKGGKVNFKTVLVKGLLWALLGAFIGFGVSELTEKSLTSDAFAAKLSGHPEMVEYYTYSQKAEDAVKIVNDECRKWCEKEGYDPDDDGSVTLWIGSGEMSTKAEDSLQEYFEFDEKADEALYEVYTDEFNEDEDALTDAIASVSRVNTALWSAVIALFVGLFLGIGEGVFYGSAQKALIYALIGAGVSIVIGYASGYIAQLMYAELLTDDPSDTTAALVRGLGWAVMGLGIGTAVGLIKPQLKRLLFCALGGLVGAFIGGFLFNYVCDIIPQVVVARGIAIVIMGILIGIGVGLLEQFAKQAWLKVIRGEFEGKEYLVFAGTTSIGNNGKNTIVLFKDKLVGSHHCDIKLEGSKYVLTDCGTPMGTIVNGMKTSRCILKQGDAISIGNSVLVFNTR